MPAHCTPAKIPVSEDWDHSTINNIHQIPTNPHHYISHHICNITDIGNGCAVCYDSWESVTTEGYWKCLDCGRYCHLNCRPFADTPGVLSCDASAGGMPPLPVLDANIAGRVEVTVYAVAGVEAQPQSDEFFIFDNDNDNDIGDDGDGAACRGGGGGGRHRGSTAVQGSSVVVALRLQPWPDQVETDRVAVNSIGEAVWGTGSGDGTGAPILALQHQYFGANSPEPSLQAQHELLHGTGDGEQVTQYPMAHSYSCLRSPIRLYMGFHTLLFYAFISIHMTTSRNASK